MKAKYDQEFIKSQDGKALYSRWRNLARLGRCEEWDDFDVFCDWAMANGLKDGMRLRRIDSRKPLGPDNCYVHETVRGAEENAVDPGFSARWNKTVNRIRVHYGLPPFEVEV